MKKTITILVAMIALLAAAFGAPIRDAMIAKILALQVKKHITAEFIKSAIESRKESFGIHGADFYEVGHVLRLRTFEEVWPEVSKHQSGSDNAWTQYLQLRTLTIAVMKEQLHKGDTLATVYANCRDGFVKTLAGEDQTFVSNLHSFITEGILELESVIDAGNRRKVAKEIEMEGRSHGNHVSDIEAMLAANVPASKIADRIMETVIIEIPSNPRNLDWPKFAMRRWKEGGEVLVKKYLTVLRLAEKDIAGVIAKK